ncbi:MAG TPA: hypothetical protein VFQ35_06270 [Polyangiaceae bacterium]|nr:hypothetical protein [Polyangiaceae bacterium]
MGRTERASDLLSQRAIVWGLASACALAGPAGCGRKASTTAAASAAPSATQTASAQLFAIESVGSKATFSMQAPLERIRGEAVDAISGEVTLNLDDIEEASGRVEVDLDKLVLFEQKRKDEKHEFSESAKNEQQNREAREWLQLEARPNEIAEEQAKRNRFPKFLLDRLEDVSASKVSALSGDERNVGAKARGSLLLHGRTNKTNARLAFTFNYANNRVQSILVKTAEPLPIALEDYDVHPRNRAGKLVKTIQEALASDYAKTLEPRVLVELSFVAKPR